MNVPFFCHYSSYFFQQIDDSAVTIKPDHETCIQHTSKAEIQCIARDTFFINFDWMIITGNSTYHTSFRCSPLDRTPSSFFNSTAFSSFSNSSMQDDRTLSLLCGIRIMPNVLLPNTTVLVTCSNVDVGISLRNALHIKGMCSYLYKHADDVHCKIYWLIRQELNAM